MRQTLFGVPLRTMPSFTLKQAAGSLSLTCDSRPALPPGQEPHGPNRKPAERTLFGSLFITHILAAFAGSGNALARSDPFAGVGISVVDQLEGIVPVAPSHSDPCPPVLSARAAIEPKTDKADAGIRPRANAIKRHKGVVKTPPKENGRYRLAAMQFSSKCLRNVEEYPFPRRSNSNATNPGSTVGIMANSRGATGLIQHESRPL